MGMFDFLKPVTTQQSVEPGTLLVVEDMFELQNVGPVVVGIASALITKGQTAAIRSGESEIPVVIAGIEKLGQQTDTCQAGDPVGLVLQNVQFSQIAQGDCIMAA